VDEEYVVWQVQEDWWSVDNGFGGFYEDIVNDLGVKYSVHKCEVEGFGKNDVDKDRGAQTRQKIINSDRDGSYWYVRESRAKRVRMLCKSADKGVREQAAGASEVSMHVTKCPLASEQARNQVSRGSRVLRLY
jgi:hypothetical protein